MKYFKLSKKKRYKVVKTLYEENPEINIYQIRKKFAELNFKAPCYEAIHNDLEKIKITQARKPKTVKIKKPEVTPEQKPPKTGYVKCPCGGQHQVLPGNAIVECISAGVWYDKKEGAWRSLDDNEVMTHRPKRHVARGIEYGDCDDE